MSIERVVVDLAGAAGSGDGVHWTLEGSGDLNANLVNLDPGHVIEEHVNREVDVLLVGVAGSGHVEVDGEPVRLAPHVAVHVPKGTRRRIVADDAGVQYLTVHRRRGRLRVGGGADDEG